MPIDGVAGVKTKTRGGVEGDQAQPAGAEPDPEIVRARAYLSRVSEPGSLPVAALVEHCGPVLAAERIKAGAVPSEVSSATAARRLSADPAADLEAAQERGIRLITPESSTWPHFAFAPLYAAQARRLQAWQAGARSARYGGEPTVPLALWVQGPLDITGMAVRSVAVVGARAATAYGVQIAAELGYELAAHDVVVVSGGAFGIDVAAHRAALAREAATVLVSAGGLDRPYPGAHAGLFERIGATGLLVSESPPGASPQKHRFLSRNRIIAALSTMTVIVEAAPRSGALNTAAHCVALGRPLFAVPGPITSALSAGCHALLRREDSPAQVMGSIGDVLALLNGSIDNEHQVSTVRDYDQLDPTARRVLDGFPTRAWASEDQLVVLSGVPALDVMRALPVLRLAGAIESGREGHRLRAPGAVGASHGRVAS